MLLVLIGQFALLIISQGFFQIILHFVWREIHRFLLGGDGFVGQSVHELRARQRVEYARFFSLVAVLARSAIVFATVKPCWSTPLAVTSIHASSFCNMALSGFASLVDFASLQAP